MFWLKQQQKLQSGLDWSFVGLLVIPPSIQNLQPLLFSWTSLGRDAKDLARRSDFLLGVQIDVPSQHRWRTPCWRSNWQEEKFAAAESCGRGGGGRRCEPMSCRERVAAPYGLCQSHAQTETKMYNPFRAERVMCRSRNSCQHCDKQKWHILWHMRRALLPQLSLILLKKKWLRTDF